MEKDPFASIIELAHPTDSQEARIPNCPMARQLEHFTDSDPNSSSSPDPTPSQPTEIVMVSPSASPDSVGEHVEDQSVFHTPPEHHPPPYLSSSEDQNLDGVEREAKKMRAAMEENMDEDTVPVGETEAIVEDTEIIVNSGNGKRIEDTVPVVETEAIVEDTEIIVNLGNGKRIEEIDEFRYDRRRQLPESLKGKEKVVESEETNGGLLEFVDVVKAAAAVGNRDDGSEDDENEHWFDMIQRKGFTFPKPRWWP